MTTSKWKLNWVTLLLVVPPAFLAQACETFQKKIEAQIWSTGTSEIFRNIKDKDGNLKQEFIPTDHESFKEFKCMQTKHLDLLINKALAGCECQ